MNLKGKTAFITGASRGIGAAIALRLATEGANVAIVAKSTEEDSRLGGTIFSTADEVRNAGGQALPLKCDIRHEDQIIEAVQTTISTFGGIDICINNASAIMLQNTETLDSKRFDLIHDINVRGTFLVTKHCIPSLKIATNPHILTLSPPLNLNPKWLAPHVGYTISKYNMSLMALGWSSELAPYGIASNSLWPITTIATAAVRNLLGGQSLVERSRNPQILADATYHILIQNSKLCTGNFFIDETVLKSAGVTNFDQYAVKPGAILQKDLYID